MHENFDLNGYISSSFHISSVGINAPSKFLNFSRSSQKIKNFHFFTNFEIIKKGV